MLSTIALHLHFKEVRQQIWGEVVF